MGPLKQAIKLNAVNFYYKTLKKALHKVENESGGIIDKALTVKALFYVP